MKTFFQQFGGVFLLGAASASATTHYVDLNGTNATPPYTNWAAAAVTIQDAVDAAGPGDAVLVNDGVYATGGRAVGTNVLVNRLVVDKPVTVQSVNGPAVTVIQGSGPMGTNGVRCVYLTNSAALFGFTVTNGATSTNGDFLKERCGGGVWCASPSVVVSNCVVSGNSANASGGGVCGGTWNNCTLSANSASVGGGTYSATLNNCTLSGNSASSAGGTYLSTLNNCTLVGNSAYDGGGVFAATLTNCTLTGNWATNGGAAEGGTLTGCTISSNSANLGGGTYQSTLTDCMITSNSANYGGGTAQGTLNYCTLLGNVATYSTTDNNGPFGGGAYFGTLNNCTLVGNAATNSNDYTRAYGGGAYWSTLNNCILSNNSATYGGGAYSAALTNCTLSSNSAQSGGGASFGTLNSCTLSGNAVTGYGGGFDGGFSGTLVNCIVYYNTALVGADYWAATLNYCCTTALPSGGSGNFTNAPLFVDLAGGNLRLQSNSPCINSGNNAYVTSSLDLDGNPRIIGGTVDIGAFEYKSPTSLIPYLWLQQYGLPTDGSADFADSDGDGMNNWQEWRAGTNPTNALSVLQMLTPSNTASGITVQWQSVSGIVYYLQRSTNLSVEPTFSSAQSNLVGQAGTTIYTDTNASGRGPVFYRVGVQ